MFRQFAFNHLERRLTDIVERGDFESREFGQSLANTKFAALRKLSIQVARPLLNYQQTTLYVTV